MIYTESNQTCCYNEGMLTIALTAPQKHGKSTFSELVHEIEPTSFDIETSTVISEVADAFHAEMPIPPEENNIEWMNKWLKILPEILQKTVHVDTTYENLRFSRNDVEADIKHYEKFFWHSVALAKNPELAEHKITPENKSAYRPILQFLGAYLIKSVSKTIWTDEIYRRVDVAKEQGAKVATVGGLRYLTDERAARQYGATIIDIFRPGMPELDLNDPTERERSKITPDIRVTNNGDKSEYKVVIKDIMNDLSAGKPKSLYLGRP